MTIDPSCIMLTYSRPEPVNLFYTGQRRDPLRLTESELKIVRRDVIHDWNIINVTAIWGHPLASRGQQAI